MLESSSNPQRSSARDLRAGSQAICKFRTEAKTVSLFTQSPSVAGHCQRTESMDRRETEVDAYGYKGG